MAEHKINETYVKLCSLASVVDYDVLLFLDTETGAFELGVGKYSKPEGYQFLELETMETLDELPRVAERLYEALNAKLTNG